MRLVTRAGTVIPYSEVLRVIGAYVERSNLQDVRILETDDALIVQGRLNSGSRTGEIDTYQLTIEDIFDLLQDARAMRGVKL